MEGAPCCGFREAKLAESHRKPRCIVEARSSHCSESIRKGRKCDVTFAEWEQLRDSSIEREEEREAELLQQLAPQGTKVIKLRKQFRQVSNGTDEMILLDVDPLSWVAGGN